MDTESNIEQVVREAVEYWNDRTSAVNEDLVEDLERQVAETDDVIEQLALHRELSGSRTHLGKVGDLARILRHIVQFFATILVAHVVPTRTPQGVPVVEGQGAGLDNRRRILQHRYEAGSVQSIGRLQPRQM